MIKRSSAAAAVFIIAAALASAPAATATHGLRLNPSQIKLAADIGPDQAAAIVRERTGGRVLGVRAVSRDGRVVYQVKVLKDGHVRIYHVDGASGNILG